MSFLSRGCLNMRRLVFFTEVIGSNNDGFGH